VRLLVVFGAILALALFVSLCYMFPARVTKRGSNSVHYIEGSGAVSKMQNPQALAVPNDLKHIGGMDSAQTEQVNVKPQMTIEELHHWMSFYYQKPRSALVPLAISAIKTEGAWKDDFKKLPIVTFFSYVFRQNPDKLETWFSQFPIATDSEEDFRLWGLFLNALWYADTAESKQQMIKIQENSSNKIITKHIVFLLGHQPVSTETLEINSAIVVDVLWAAFFATGDVQHILRIMSVLPLINLEKNQENEVKIAIGTLARASLAANALQHDIIKETIIAEISHQSDSIGEVLKAIAAEFPTGKP